MRLIKPAPVEHKHKRKVFFYKNLINCTHVFLRKGMVKKSLECPYSGPHKVVQRTSDRVYELDANGVFRQVSVENLKPVYFARNEECGETERVKEAASPILSTNVPIASPTVLHQQVRPVLRTYVNKKKQVTFDVLDEKL